MIQSLIRFKLKRISFSRAGRAAFGGVVLASMAFVKRKRPC